MAMAMLSLESDAAKRRMTLARSKLLVDHPWFGSLALRLALVEVKSGGSLLMATDGTSLYYDPDEVLKIPVPAVMTIVAHEILHCALLHMFRFGARAHQLWNIACDHVVNLALEAAGFPFPTGAWAGLRDKRFTGMTAEQVYAILQSEQQPDGGFPGISGQGGAGDQSGKPGPGQPPPGWTPDLKKPPTPKPSTGVGQEGTEKGKANGPETEPLTEGDWKIAAEQAAMVAKRAGRMPAGMDRLIRQAREPKVDWIAALREFVTHTMPTDYRWTQPNRRFVAQGLYLPGVWKQNAAKMVVAIDTSGSVDERMLQQASGELRAILADVRPELLTVLYCDTEVGRVDEFTPDGAPAELVMVGGGGTKFNPVFEWVAEHLDEPPACLIYLTDLMCFDSPVEPDYPVLWVTTIKTSQEGPFGQTLHAEVD